MTPEERARRAVEDYDGDVWVPVYAQEAIERNVAAEIRAAVAEEREACAIVAMVAAVFGDGTFRDGVNAALLIVDTAIRARGGVNASA